MNSTRKSRSGAAAVLITTLTALVCAATAGAAETTGYVRDEPICGRPAPGEAMCLALARVRVPPSQAGRPGVRPLAARPPALEFGPGGEEGLTPALLASAYGYDPKAGGTGKTVAVVDAFDDPNIEEDLAKFSSAYALPQCTSKSGCFRKINQFGSSSPSSLPAADTKGWSVEISLDVETIHSVCQECHILLVEAKNAQIFNLGTAVATAVEQGAAVVSNSFGAPEDFGISATERALFEHPGTVITAATGDFGYDGWLSTPRGTPDEPASLPGVVSVGGTTLRLDESGKRASETAWNESGGGCSARFEAPIWQRYAAGFGATGCGSSRLSADVSADADPATGFEIYDSYDCGPQCESFIGGGGWATIGGTSLSAPLIGSLFALAGGADGIEYPALTLYAHLGDTSLFDVEGGGNGECFEEGLTCAVAPPYGCERATSCNAAPGYDGPSGVGSPRALAAFEPVPGEEAAAWRKAEEAIQAEARAREEQERSLRETQERAARDAAELVRQRAEENARKAAEEAARAAGGQGTAGFKAVKAAVPNATLRGARLQAGRGGVLVLKIACPSGVTSCQGKVAIRTLSAVLAAHGGVLTLAGGHFKVAGGHVGTVRLRLTARARSLLASRGSLRVRVTIVAHDPSGAGHTSHATATLHAFRGHG